MSESQTPKALRPESDVETDDAILTVARQVLANLIDAEMGQQWENYPEIGEYDWERISEAVSGMADPPDMAVYTAAYGALEARAEDIS